MRLSQYRSKPSPDKPAFRKARVKSVRESAREAMAELAIKPGPAWARPRMSQPLFLLVAESTLGPRRPPASKLITSLTWPARGGLVMKVSAPEQQFSSGAVKSRRMGLRRGGPERRARA